MKSFDYVINDELGIHARPAGLLCKAVKDYKCTITLKKGEKSVSCKGVMGVMTLNVKKGDLVTVLCDGEDEEKAVSELKEFFTNNL